MLNTRFRAVSDLFHLSAEVLRWFLSGVAEFAQFCAASIADFVRMLFL